MIQNDVLENYVHLQAIDYCQQMELSKYEIQTSIFFVHAFSSFNFETLSKEDKHDYETNIYVSSHFHFFK